jgi:hypothetical protein
MTLNASPAFAESDSYEEMLKNFRAKQSDTVKQYEKAAKTSSNLIALPTPAVSDKLPFSSFFGDKDAGKAPDAAPSVKTENPKPLSSFAAPKVDTPKMPDLPEMPSFSVPKMPSFSAPKFEIPKLPDMPKMDIPSFEAPSLPSVPAPPPEAAAPAVPAAPKAIAPPPVVAKPYVPPTPPPVSVAPLPAAVTPTPIPAPAAPAASSQGDYMDRWQRDQAESGSTTKGVTTPSQRNAATRNDGAKEAANKKAAVARSGKRQGPLPLWFAEILMLGLIGGIGYAVVFLQDPLKAAYVAADKSIAAATANFNKRSE